MKTSFRKRIKNAIANPVLQQALDNNADRRRSAQFTALESLGDSQYLKDNARRIRKEVIGDLYNHLKTFKDQAKRNGLVVYEAADAEEACSIVTQIARNHKASLVAKSKSMVSEEIQLNQALEKTGLRVVETDLGEYIIQLRGEHPTHIITPAIHLLKEQVAQTFHEELGAPYSSDVSDMTLIARQKLREVFLEADIGISGVNFGVVETGTLCLVTNEGNGRMVTTLPPVHVALMGIERLVPTLEDLALMLKLLPRSATGQKLTTYTSLIQGAQQATDPDGAMERHLILIDNGRSNLHSSSLQESLLCIRCGACLNACPVFREVGGHAYQSVYPGPIGSVISAGLISIEEYGYLAKASTLCAACRDACPVSIDFPTLLLRVRDETVRTTGTVWGMSVAMRIFSWLVRSPARFSFAQRMAAFGSKFLPKEDGWIDKLPTPLSAWTDSRRFPAFKSRPLRDRISDLDLQPISTTSAVDSKIKVPQSIQPTAMKNYVDQFQDELESLGGSFRICSKHEIAGVVFDTIQELGQDRILSWNPTEPLFDELLASLSSQGLEVVYPSLPSSEGHRGAPLAEFGSFNVGLTGANAGLADTGTIILESGEGRSQLASLLPLHHLAILPIERIYPDLESWLADGGEMIVANTSQLNFITGPSRTADIEMTLTIGVHGPGSVLVIGVEQSH